MALEHGRLFVHKAFPEFHDAAVRAARGEDNPWPSGLRVKRVEGTRGVWEMTWKFRNPDGQATWQWDEIDGEAGILWRRVGSHGVFESP